MKMLQFKLVKMKMLQVAKKYFSHIYFTNDFFIICQAYSIVIGNRSEWLKKIDLLHFTIYKRCELYGISE